MPTYTVQGQQTDSVNEYYVSKALTKMKLDYSYHYAIDGGSGVRGGQIIDFVIWRPPRPVSVNVGTGGYYHSGRRSLEDEIKQVRQAQLGFEVVNLMEAPTSTEDGALAECMQVIGV